MTTDIPIVGDLYLVRVDLANVGSISVELMNRSCAAVQYLGTDIT